MRSSKQRECTSFVPSFLALYFCMIYCLKLITPCFFDHMARKWAKNTASTFMRDTDIVKVVQGMTTPPFWQFAPYAIYIMAFDRHIVWKLGLGRCGIAVSDIIMWNTCKSLFTNSLSSTSTQYLLWHLHDSSYGVYKIQCCGCRFQKSYSWAP